MNQQPIFRSVGQALHVSFLMEILPVTQAVSTQVLIEGLRKQCGAWDDAPPAQRAVNFGGLSPLEVRGQCAMVRATVTDHLPGPERDAILARFGHQKTKAAGVRGLASYVQPLSGVRHELALQAVAWSLFQPAKRVQDRWSFREIEEETGVSKSALHRAAAVLKAQAQALERRADERLSDLFARTLLIEDERTLQVC